MRKITNNLGVFFGGFVREKERTHQQENCKALLFGEQQGREKKEQLTDARGITKQDSLVFVFVATIAGNRLYDHLNMMSAERNEKRKAHYSEFSCIDEEFNFIGVNGSIEIKRNICVINNRNNDIALSKNKIKKKRRMDEV